MYEIGLAKIYSCTKFDVSIFTHSRFMEEGLKFKIWALTLTTPLLGYFVTVKMGLACTEFEVSSFTRSKFMEGGLKFKNSTLDPDHAPF